MSPPCPTPAKPKWTQAEAESIAGKPGPGGKQLFPYQCRCAGWHLASSPLKAWKRMTRESPAYQGPNTPGRVQPENPPYTAEQDAMILAGEVGYPELARQWGRTMQAVRNRSVRLQKRHGVPRVKSESKPAS